MRKKAPILTTKKQLNRILC